MSKIKKVLAMLLALAMVLGTTLTASAEPGKKPVEGDKATATVNNVEATATVIAYQVVKANYNDAGFIGYSTVSGYEIGDPLHPTSDEITAIANSDTSRLKRVQMTAGEADGKGLASFTADLEPGYWMVLVNGTVDEVYNPMLVGIAYSKSGSDNTMEAGPVDANSDWTLVTNGAYAKSTKPSIDKTILPEGEDTKQDLAIGDYVQFQIKTNIPSYSKDYEEVIVKISDSLSKGLTLVNDEKHPFTVSLDDENYTFTKAISTDGFEIQINSDYALEHGKDEVVITYYAQLNKDAGLNFDANTNTATLTYSNDPSDSSKTKDTDKRTYNYTFAIDSKLNGETESEWNKITEELVKGEMVDVTTETGTEKKFQALKGATFTLTNNNTNKVYTAISDDNGRLAFTGLDAGEYTLVETVAPEGYTVNDEKIPVVISAEYNDDGTLKSYSIKINNKATSTYEATYEGKGTSTTIKNVVQGEGNETTQVLNTKIGKLPSTGGIGTTIFTIGGCLIMIVAAGLFFASRRKSAK